MISSKHFRYIAALSLLALLAAGSGERKHGAPVEPAVVPDYLCNVVLGRPGADSITASVIAWKEMNAAVAYGERADALTLHTQEFRLASGEPRHVVLERLKPNTRYFYQLEHRIGGTTAREEVRSFHTQRTSGTGFTFDVQADSHLDTSTDPRVYEQTLTNISADRPDFLIDLGDTFMVDKFRDDYKKAASQYLAQRYYFGIVAHSAPLFLALGNHDGEQSSRLSGTPDSMSLWSLAMRKKFFPNPEPGGIYSGNATPLENAGLLQDYFAWQWGDALFVVLDPFWFTTRKINDDNWNMTLGDTQYRWLAKTLESCKAKFKFVFIHHLVGGRGKDARGGASEASFFEWGGKNEDGSNGFAQHRPGWPLPIHQLLVKNRVSIVFHGHDHLFVKEELDGVIYQEVPQPSNPIGGTRSAGEYGYTGLVLSSPGFLRVSTDSDGTKIEYVKTSVPGVTKTTEPNGTVAHRYVVWPQ